MLYRCTSLSHADALAHVASLGPGVACVAFTRTPLFPTFYAPILCTSSDCAISLSRFIPAALAARVAAAVAACRRMCGTGAVPHAVTRIVLWCGFKV